MVVVVTVLLGRIRYWQRRYGEDGGAKDVGDVHCDVLTVLK
jgi:hypothetical protein